MSSSKSIVQILWRYKNRETLTDEQLMELRSWLEESPEHEDLFDDLSNEAKWDKEIEARLARGREATWNKIVERVEELEPENGKRIIWRRFEFAAAILFIALVGAALYTTLNHKPVKNKGLFSGDNLVKGEIDSLKTATLILGDGTVVKIDSARRGGIALQGKTSISMYDSGVLRYVADHQGQPDPLYNTLVSGKEGISRLTLPDGTLVWVNVGSSLRFPVAFVGSTRTVELTGEAYFEVTKNKEKPFIVQTAHSRIRVVGTHFDVDAYPGVKNTKTSLFEGSVLLSDGQDSVLMKPGQQITSAGNGSFKIDTVNKEQVLAWKNNMFWFHETSLPDIMSQVAKKYHIEVSYEAPVKYTFTGLVPQDLPLLTLLDIIDKSGNVHFVISGNKVIVKR